MSPTIVAGIIVAALIGAGLAIWLVIRWYRKRNNPKHAAFVTFNGSNDDVQEKSPFPRCVCCMLHVEPLAIQSLMNRASIRDAI